MQFIRTIVYLVLVFATSISAIRIASFNLQQYGEKKSTDALVTSRIATILNDFDLIVIQEISDVTVRAPYVLHDVLNGISRAKPYSMTLSSRVGRSATKEQFAFFNRQSTSGVQLINSYVYNDVEDKFERPPFIGTFKVINTGSSGVEYFTIINVHLRPSAAYDEFLAIRHVIEDLILKYPRYFTDSSTSIATVIEQNVIDATANHKPSLKTKHPILIMGDFNADSPYISLRLQASLRSIDYADFTWMINNQVKTNTRQTATYDRILINGDKFIRAIVRNSNTTVNFQQRFHLTLAHALTISDHLPIKFDINW